MCVCVWHTFVTNQVFRRVCTAVVTIDLSFACMYSNSQPHNEFCTLYETVFGIIYKASKTMGNNCILHNFRDTV